MWFSFFSSIAILELINKVSASSGSGNNNVAIYWGQNSAAYGQQPLKYYCDSDAVDIVILSFMQSFPNWDLNFATECLGGLTTSEGKPYCPEIGQDITYCQSKGKKVLLSLGGALGLYGFTDDSQAIEFASTLWNQFAGGSSAVASRPFGSAILDGFDLDIESGQPRGFAALSTALRTHYALDSSRQYYVSAAPQCFYPDASVGDALANSDIDFAFIQFYNNYCNLNAQFNWDTWQEFANSVSPNKNIKLYVGLPGAPLSAGSGYVSPAKVKALLPQYVLDSPNFGGISLWDMASSFANIDNGVNFAQLMKEIVAREVVATTSSSSLVVPTTSSSTLVPKTSSTTLTTPITFSSPSSVSTVTSSSVTSSETTPAPVSTTELEPTSSSSSQKLSVTIPSSSIVDTTSQSDATLSRILPTTFVTVTLPYTSTTLEYHTRITTKLSVFLHSPFVPM